MFNVVRNSVAACLMMFAGGAVNAATIDQFQAVVGGELETVSVSISGDADGFTASSFSPPWTVTTSASGADATLQEFNFMTFSAETVLALTAIDQEFGAGVYRGLFDVVTDIAGVWGDFALVEITAPSLTEFTSGTLTVTEAELAAVDVNPVPLPAGAWFLLSGIVGLGVWKRTS